MNTSYSSCVFCDGQRNPTYKLNNHQILQCASCLASSVANPPTDQEIGEFYDGFAFQMDRANLDFVITPAIHQWFDSLGLPKDAKMLDVGGGAGFFAKAFEHFGKGTSSFIDLDESACRFAREEIGLDNVIHDDIRNITRHYSEAFDFIYCRHVIEHIVDPTEMIEASLKLLKPGGIYILQFPNGLSLEYLAFPGRQRPFARRLKHSNGFSNLKALKVMVSKSNGFGLDPIRHLWALPPESIKRYLGDRKDLSVTTRTASVTDPVFSPYYQANTFLGRIQSFLGRHVLSKIKGGAHGIVEIRKFATSPN